MNIARYWATATARAEDPDGNPMEFTIRRGSDISQDDARHNAEDAAKAIAGRLRAGHEPPKWYEYSTRQLPEPILEEISDESGQRAGAITINRFGCEVLNTQRLAFLDIDLKPSRSRRASGALLGRLFGRGKAEQPTGDTTQIAVDGALSQLKSWVRKQPRTGVRAYRTSAGLRYLFVSPAMDPMRALHEPVYEELGCDPLYRRLCVAQDCFRARLTPKPWRINVPTPREWRVDRLEAEPSYYDRWHESYLVKAGNYAACAYLDSFGETDAPDETAARLIAIHDERSGALSGMTLA